jgi:hypothetical protein
MRKLSHKLFAYAQSLLNQGVINTEGKEMRTADPRWVPTSVFAASC